MFAITPVFRPGGMSSFSEQSGGGACFRELFVGRSATFDPHYENFIPHRKVARRVMADWFSSREPLKARNNWRQVRAL